MIDEQILLDADIREPLFDYLEQRYEKVRFLEEKVTGKARFYRVREAQPNPKMKLKNKLSLLWKSELAHIQAKAGMPKYTNKSKKFIAEILIEQVPAEILQEQISNELFERDYTIYD